MLIFSPGNHEWGRRPIYPKNIIKLIAGSIIKKSLDSHPLKSGAAILSANSTWGSLRWGAETKLCGHTALETEVEKRGDLLLVYYSRRRDQTISALSRSKFCSSIRPKKHIPYHKLNFKRGWVGQTMCASPYSLWIEDFATVVLKSARSASEFQKT